MIDTTDGGSLTVTSDSRNTKGGKPAMTGRSYQLDSRPIPREEVTLSSADELAYQTMNAMGGN